MWGGKTVVGNMKVGKMGEKGKTRIGKAFTQCKKGSAEKIMGRDLSKKCPKRGEIQGKARKNSSSGLKRVT